MSVFALQTLCLGGTAVAVYLLGARVFGRSVGLTAAVLAAADLMSSVLAFEAMSESLFNLFVTVGTFLWVHALSTGPGCKGWYARSSSSGVFLGLAMLTRPAALYLPLVCALAGLTLGARLRSRAAFMGTVVLVVSSYACALPWVVRNYEVFGIPRLSTADTINLVYFCGAGAYGVENGVTLVEAQEAIRKEYHLVSLTESNNHWTVDRTVKDFDDDQRRAVPSLLLRHPKSLLIATSIGITKALISHNVSDYAHMRGSH